MHGQGKPFHSRTGNLTQCPPICMPPSAQLTQHRSGWAHALGEIGVGDSCVPHGVACLDPMAEGQAIKCRIWPSSCGLTCSDLYHRLLCHVFEPIDAQHHSLSILQLCSRSSGLLLGASLPSPIVRRKLTKWQCISCDSGWLGRAVVQQVWVSMPG